MRTKRGNGVEMQTRTGCNKCRQRRVKCPGQKPVCKACQTLGFVCSYDRALRWERVKVSYPGCCPAAPATRQQVEKWMFLQVSQDDFRDSHALPFLFDSDSEGSVTTGIETTAWPEVVSDFTLSTFEAEGVCPWISPLCMSSTESRLWAYFHEAIAPTCVLNPRLNPYQDAILRIAASTGNGSPLFQSIMAISSSQLYILGHQSFHALSWYYRHQALRRLRLEPSKMERGILAPASSAQILATVMALVFLDILSDCSASWVVHSNFARSLIRDYRHNHAPSDEDIEALFRFVGGYIVVHEVYAHSAWSADVSVASGPVTTMCDDSNLQTLTGCSTEFFQILADINSLAFDYSGYSKLACPDPKRSQIYNNAVTTSKGNCMAAPLTMLRRRRQKAKPKRQISCWKQRDSLASSTCTPESIIRDPTILASQAWHRRSWD